MILNLALSGESVQHEGSSQGPPGPQAGVLWDPCVELPLLLGAGLV